jgi:RHS repeat-associated protein
VFLEELSLHLDFHTRCAGCFQNDKKDYAYDANRNLVSRISGGQTLSFVYDAENRLVGVSGAASAAFVYDGDGRRVKGTVNGVTTYYVGDYYEVSGGVVKKYYSAGGQRIAMRSGGALYWLLNDHLGGTAHTISGTTETGEVRYRAFGVTRFTSGTTPTTYRFTGQREEAALGLYYYNARWYDPALGHFLSPDSIVPEPGNALDYHRYAYVRFNPLKYTDPSGHCPQPSGEFANSNIICVAGFIPTQTSSGLPGLVYFRGDDRDFSNASNPEASRFWLWISADSGEILASFVHPTQRASSPLGGPLGNSSSPRNQPHANPLLEIILGSNRFFTQKAEDGTISLSYHVVCSDPICNNAFAPDGQINFTPDGQGSYAAYGLVNRFPNLEAYHWNRGNLQEESVLRLQFFKSEERTRGHAGWISSFGMRSYEYFDTRPGQPSRSHFYFLWQRFVSGG